MFVKINIEKLRKVLNMNEIEKQILEDYARKYSIASISYKMLGLMLDEKYVEERLKLFGIKQMYIYGGTYMAIQLYRMGKKYTDIKGIVDKSCRIAINDNISVIALDEFKEIYSGEKVIITSIRFFQEIKKDIEVFVNTRDIINIGELIMGITKGIGEYLE